MTTGNLPAHLRDREHQLVGLIEPLFPFEGTGHGPRDAWPTVAHALVSHATRTYRAVNLLSDHGLYVDAARLTRSLYDHVVNLAWLAVDVESRLERWRLHDLHGRLKAHNDAGKMGVELLVDETLADARAAAAGGDNKLPDLLSRAIDADAFWRERGVGLAAGDQLRSFTGLYVLIFRNYSAYVHATFAGLNAVTEDLPDFARRVHLTETHAIAGGVAGIASAVYGVGLLVLGGLVGRPTVEGVDAVFANTERPTAADGPTE